MYSSAFYYLSQAFSTNSKTFKALLMMGLSDDWPRGAHDLYTDCLASNRPRGNMARNMETTKAKVNQFSLDNDDGIQLAR
jgi:hypothetical protein